MDQMAMVKICFLMLLCIVGVSALALEDTSSYTVGLLVQSSSQLTHFLQSSTTIAKMDISGYRFYKTTFSGIPVIMGYTGNDLINGALTTQLLITSFPSVTTVVNFGHSASPDVENINLGDIVMPTKLAHTGNWFWQNVGDTTTEGEASLTFSDFNSNLLCLSGTNKLNRVWYQDSEVYDNSEGYDPYDTSSSVFWVNASTNIATPYVLLQSCADVNGTEECLAYTPKVVRTDAGCSADIYISNAAYAEFLLSTFSCSTLDKDAASIGSVCLRNNVSFVALRSISNTAGISSTYNEPKSELLHKLANYNSIAALQGVISQLSTPPLSPPISESPPPPPPTPHPPILEPPPPPPPPPPHHHPSPPPPSPPPPPISKPPPPITKPPPPSPPPPPPPISKSPPPPPPPPAPSSESARSLSTRILCYAGTLSLSMYLLAIMV